MNVLRVVATDDWNYVYLNGVEVWGGHRLEWWNVVRALDGVLWGDTLLRYVWVETDGLDDGDQQAAILTAIAADDAAVAESVI